MKAGTSINNLMTELEHNARTKRDLVAPQGALRVCSRTNGVELAWGQNTTLPLRPIAHRQLGEQLKIPAKFYDRLLEKHPDLLATTANRFLMDDPNAKRMVRTLGGSVRAILSNSYRILDNFDVATAVLPVLQECGAELMSCEVTERRLYLKAILPGVTAEIPPPGVTNWEWGKEHHAIDVVQPGIEIGNSEVGFGSLYTKPGVHTVKCSNLAVFAADKMRKTHLGKAFEVGNVNMAMSDTTRRLADAAVWSALADLVRACFDGTLFNKYVDELKVARGQLIEPEKCTYVVTEITNGFSLLEHEHDAVMGNFIGGEDRTRYGIAAAITRAAQDAVSYDRATELEHIGGQVIELPSNQWETILKAAA